MTVIANVKSTLASAKGIQASFAELAQLAQEDTAKRIFHECMLEADIVVKALEQRMEWINAEEWQYRNS